VDQAAAALAALLLTDPPVPVAAAKALEAARRLTASEAGCLGSTDTQTGRLVWLASEPVSWCEGGEGGEGGEAPLLLDPWLSEAKIVEGAARVARCGVRSPGRRRLRRLLVVPARVGGATVGQLVLGGAAKPYPARAIEAVARLAGLWATTLGRAGLTQRLGELRERDALLFDSHPDGVAIIADGVFVHTNPAFADLLGWSQDELLGRRPTEFVGPAEEGPVLTRMATGQGGTRDNPSEYRLIRKDGTVVAAEAVSRVISWGGRPAFLSVFRDISLRKQAEEALRHRQFLLQTLADFDQTISHLSSSRVVRSALTFIRPRVSADRLTVTLREGEGQISHLAFAEGEGADRLGAGVRFPLEGTGLAEAIESGQAVYQPDFAQVPSLPILRELLSAGLRSGLAVPLIFAGRCLGTLNATSRVPFGIPEADRQLLTLLAPRLASALQNSILYEDLQASEKRFHTIFDTVPVSIWEEDFTALKKDLDRLRGEGITDFRGYLDSHPEFLDEAARGIRILDVNDYTLKLYKAEGKAELLGALDRVFTAESYPAFAGQLAALAEGRTFFECEGVNRAITGEALSVMVKVEFPPSDGDFSRVVVSITDLTTRRQVEEEIRHRTRLENLITTISTHFINLEGSQVEQGIEAALRAIGEFASVDRSYVLLLSEDRRRAEAVLEWCSAGADCRAEGRAGALADGMRWFAKPILRGETVQVPRVSDLPPEAGRARRAALARGAKSLVLVPISSRGAVVGLLGLDSTVEGKGWADDVIALLKIAGEIIVGALERKRAGEALLRAHGELERRVAERTADLERAKRELEDDIAARRRAEQEKATLEWELRQSRVLEAVGQLAGGVAHDFNNILGSVIGCLYAARLQAGADPGLREELERAQALCKRGGELTRQLLTVARRRPGRPEPLAVAGLFEEARFLLERTLPKAIALAIELEPGLPLVRADRSMFTAALLNLGHNARDAMPRGGTLRISAFRQAEPGVGGREWVVVEVSDTGVGIPWALQDRVFDPFFTTKAPGEGTGLGLSMVEAAVRECGGLVSLRSEPGVGTTFTLRFPSEGAGAGRPIGDAGGARHPCTASPVLVVEDEENVARMIVQILEAHGYTILRAATGVEALERVHEQRGDLGLVILDLVLPELGGEEVYRLLKGLAPEVSVLLITGREDRARALAPGAPLLPKPFTPEELLESIAELLGRRRG
jgi:PAS domain S-box-containing protein